MKNETVKTTDYDQFKIMLGNRALNPTNLKLIMRSILERDLLQQNPITVNEHMEIVDGQHRLEVARRLRLPLYYSVVEGSTLQDVIRLNAAKRIWHNDDYLDSYIALGNKQYITLKEFMNEYKMRFSVALSLLMGHSITQGGHSELGRPIDIFRRGNLKITHLEYAQDIANDLLVLAERCMDDCWKERAFVCAFQKIVAEIPFRDFLKQLDKSKITFNHKKNVKSYLQVFEEVVNFGKREATQFY